jgi:acid-sensing ion channel, other
MDLVSDYLDNSSIHGFKYIGDKTRPWFERILWIVIFLISFFGCCKLIFDVHQKFDQNPVIVTFDEKPTKISEIPFPAVTVCPVTKTQKKLFNVTAFFHELKDPNFLLYNLNKTEIAKLVAVSQVCLSKIFHRSDPKNKTNCAECIQTLREIGIPKKDMLVLCDFVKGNESCDALFQETITDDGICYTFNKLLGSTPRRVTGAGNEFSLELTLELCEENFDYLCRGASQGFKVSRHWQCQAFETQHFFQILLHNPDEAPQLKYNYYRVPLKKEILIAIRPQMLTTSEGLRSYPPEKRQCYFSMEKKLQFFDIYTERNCKMECMANFTLQQCGCVKFYMPSKY